MDYLNRCVLLGRYKSITTIDDDIACLIIVVNDKDGDITIPIIVGSQIADLVINKCEENCLMGIKAKIDADDKGIIIKAEQISFLEHNERAD